MPKLVAFKVAGGGTVILEDRSISSVEFSGLDTDPVCTLVANGVAYPLANSALQVITALGGTVPTPPP